MTQNQLDIVIPVFNEDDIIETLHRRVVAACRETGLPYQVIYVDDGSRDGTARWIIENAIEKPDFDSGSVRLVQLSRNFGQPAAILAGLQVSSGSCTVLMDGDLQDPPELIPEMVSRWENGDEVVIAQRTSRKESFVRGLGFKTFHRVFRYLSDSEIPPNTGTFCLMDREAVQAICQLPESHRFFPGLRAWIGYRQSMLTFERPERAGGVPKQTFRRLLRYALDAVFGFSLKPLRLLTGVGATICLFSFLMASWFIFKRMIGWETASIGFTTITCAVFGLGGFQLVGLGVLGEYIGRIYDEVKGRPPFIVARSLGSESGRFPIAEIATRKAG